MDTSEEQMSARTKIPCPECGRDIHTRQSANTTRCPVTRGGCGALVYAPARPVRSLAAVSCLHCPAVWETRSKAGNMVRCPDCRKPRRVPAGIRQVDYAPPVAPSPKPRSERRPSQPRRSTWTPPVRERPVVAPQEARRPVAAPSVSMVVGKALAGLRRTTAPAPAPTPTPDPTPRQAAAVAPAVDHVPSRNEEKDQRRRQSITALVTSLGGPFRVAYDSPLGTCESMNVSLPKESQRCQMRATRAVVFGNTFTLDVAAYVCADHAGPLAAMAQRSDQVAVEIRNLRKVGS